MSKLEAKLLAATLVIAVAATVGCSRKSGDGTGSDKAPAPEVVMPETNTPPAVETAPTLAPDSAATPPAATPATSAPATTSPSVTTPAAAPATANSPAAAASDPLLSIAQSRAAAIDSGLAGYTMHNQPQEIGDVRSDISIYSSAGNVVYIEEKQTTSDNSISTNKYYFDNGKLFYYQDDGRWLDVNPPNPLTTRNTRRNMAFTAGGKLITAAKTVDGVTSGVSEYEAVAVLTRAEQLLGPLPTAAANSQKATDKPKTEAGTAAKKDAIPDKSKADVATMSKKETENASSAKPEPTTTSKPADKPGGSTGSRIEITAGNKNQLHGSAPVHGTRDYVIHGKAGQLLTLSLDGASNAVFAVYSNRGEIVSDLTNWSSKLPRDGDYTIKVGQQGGSAPAEFVLNLKLE